jgi:hypothetical protein
MKLQPFFLGLLVCVAMQWPAATHAADTRALLDQFKAYEQGKAVSQLATTRQAVFLGTDDATVRAGRERELLEFIASDANPQAKAIAIEWLGSIGSAASVPGLVAARATPALAAPVAAALERIPGPEAAQARLPKPATPPTVNAASAEVAAFASALDKEPGSPAADGLIAGAMRSPNALLAGAALRRIRAGTGSAALPKLLLDSLAQLPPARQDNLCEALATRPDAANELRTVLTARVQKGEMAAIGTLGLLLRPKDLALVLGIATDTSSSDLLAAVKAALCRGTDPGLNPALMRVAGNGGIQAIFAIEALAGRSAVEAVDSLWALTSVQDANVAAAAFKALGTLINPGQLSDLVKKLVAAEGTPQAGELDKLIWNVIRRHPDPAAAASLLDEASSMRRPPPRKSSSAMPRAFGPRMRRSRRQSPPTCRRMTTAGISLPTAMRKLPIWIAGQPPKCVVAML